MESRLDRIGKAGQMTDVKSLNALVTGGGRGIGAAIAAALTGAAALWTAGPARAADTVRMGKSLATLFAYTPIDVGLAEGFFQKENLDVQVTAFNGAATQYRGLTADAIDMSLSSGPGMVFVTKGLPAKAVAAIMGRPYLVVIVPADSPAKTIDDLKGKNIGVATTGSVTEWAPKEVARKRGWAPGDLKTVAIGGEMATTTAALVTHRVDATIQGLGVGFSDMLLGDETGVFGRAHQTLFVEPRPQAGEAARARAAAAGT